MIVGVSQFHMHADIVIFNPKTIQGTATFAKPTAYPEGIEAVLVNGTITINKGHSTGEKAGSVLRREAIATISSRLGDNECRNRRMQYVAILLLCLF